MTTRKFSLLLWLSIFVASCAIGQTTDKRDAILWEITGNGLSSPSYLLGTCHVVPYTYTDSIPGYKEAYASVGQVVIEHDISAGAEIFATADMQAILLMPSDTTYAMLFTPEELTELNNVLQGYGMPQAEQLALRPAFLEMSLAMVQEAMRLQGQAPMDMDVINHGRADGKKAVFLETLDDAKQVLKYLFAKDLNMQAQSLLRTLRQLRDGVNPALEIIQNYKVQELELILQDENFTAQDRDVTVDRRNAKWLEQIPALIADTPTLIAVGAGHLCGEKGLVQGLRARGYKLRPLSL